MNEAFGQIRLHRDNWLVAHIVDDLGDYYYDIYERAIRSYGLDIQKPSWGSHISIVRGEEIPNLDYWDTLHEKDIAFKFNPFFRTNGKHVWLDIHCPSMFDIRRGLGLRARPEYSFHMTICSSKSNRELFIPMVLK